MCTQVHEAFNTKIYLNLSSESNTGCQSELYNLISTSYYIPHSIGLNIYFLCVQYIASELINENVDVSN